VQDIKTPLFAEWRLVRLRENQGRGRNSPCNVPGVHLPAGLDGCSIRFAYQAADAGHPRGAEQARRMQGNFAGQLQTLPRPKAANAPVGKSITRGKRRLHPMVSLSIGRAMGVAAG
jgi:hypothetical protein